MTGEEFRSLYRLGDRLTDPPIVTHQATDLSGASVLVHFFLDAVGDTGSSYLDRLPNLPSAEERRVREVIEVEGRSVVVTEAWDGFSSFQEWIDSAAGTRPIPGESASGEPPPDSEALEEPGAYTQLFKAPVTDFEAAPPAEPATREGQATLEPPPAAPEAPSSPAHPVSEDDPPAAEKNRGSYTMLFGGGDIPEPKGEEAPPPATPELPDAGDQAPPAVSEPEKAPSATAPVPSAPVFPSPEQPARPPPDDGAAPPEPIPPPEQPAAEAPVEEPTSEPAEEDPDASSSERKDGEPGAYTQIFGRPAAGGTPSQPPQTPGGYQAPPSSVGQPVPPAKPPSQGASPPDWQRWKDSPGAAGRHIPSDDYLQRLGVSLGSVPEPPRSGAPPAESPGGEPPSPPSPFPGGPDTPAGPGHYTMVREGFSPGPMPPSQPAPEPAPTDEGTRPASMPSRRSSVLTILGLIAVLLIIVALVVVFAVFG